MLLLVMEVAESVKWEPESPQGIEKERASVKVARQKRKADEKAQGDGGQKKRVNRASESLEAEGDSGHWEPVPWETVEEIGMMDLSPKERADRIKMSEFATALGEPALKIVPAEFREAVNRDLERRDARDGVDQDTGRWDA